MERLATLTLLVGVAGIVTMLLTPDSFASNACVAAATALGFVTFVAWIVPRPDPWRPRKTPLPPPVSPPPRARRLT